ncbi:MgtC/SapB family protein [Lysobacter niabensis]|uniref:MgtC/SapB family protein n=1 Tax=Agrilutibacter niabensis TaxID=380628 RepID=UPI00362194C8
MFSESLYRYWGGDILAANAFIGLNLVGALLLGMLVGYERSYQGRAAGMRTYGLVCMASTALTIFVGFAPLWYGGAHVRVTADPTRVVQGIVTGIGFLCAGVIMKDGLNIRGLTSAASIWAVAAVGILLGAGFYPAALLLALLCAACMSLLQRIEARLPGRASLKITVKFRAGHPPDLEEVVQRGRARGYRVLRESLTITFSDNQAVWRFGVVALERSRALSPDHMAEELSKDENIVSFSIAPVRH